MPRIVIGRFFAVPLAPGGGLALFVPAAGAGGLVLPAGAGLSANTSEPSKILGQD
jgi:hypothetical protein